MNTRIALCLLSVVAVVAAAAEERQVMEHTDEGFDPSMVLDPDWGSFNAPGSLYDAAEEARALAREKARREASEAHLASAKKVVEDAMLGNAELFTAAAPALFEAFATDAVEGEVGQRVVAYDGFRDFIRLVVRESRLKGGEGSGGGARDEALADVVDEEAMDEAWAEALEVADADKDGAFNAAEFAVVVEGIALDGLPTGTE